MLNWRLGFEEAHQATAIDLHRPLQTIVALSLLIPISAAADYWPPPEINTIAAKVYTAQAPLKVIDSPKAKLSLAPFPYLPTGSRSNTYAPANCTAYVAGRKNIPDSWGNANTWADRAKEAGITVSDIPVVGSIAQTSRGGYGHVALVITVEADQVLIDEQNYDYAGGIRERWASTSEFVYIWV